MNPIAAIGRWLDAGWFTRVLVVFQFWFCWFVVDWSMAYASTALQVCVGGKCDLLGAAANIGAVAAIPQALLVYATKSYQELRAKPKEAP